MSLLTPIDSIPSIIILTKGAIAFKNYSIEHKKFYSPTLSCISKAAKIPIPRLVSSLSQKKPQNQYEKIPKGKGARKKWHPSEKTLRNTIKSTKIIKCNEKDLKLRGIF